MIPNFTRRRSINSRPIFNVRVTICNFVSSTEIFVNVRLHGHIFSRYSEWLLAGRPRRRSLNLGGGKNFHFSMSSRPVLGPTQLPIQWVPGALYLGVKRPGREADQSPPASAEVKKIWINTSTPPYVLMA
jgi:hypothetical protein